MADEAEKRAAVLRVRGLVVEYGSGNRAKRAVDGADLDLVEGEVLGLVGPSGSGKSSTALALLGLVKHPGRIREGEVWFRERNLLTLEQESLRRLRGHVFALVPQNPRGALHPMIPVGNQIARVARTHLPVSKSEARERTLEALRTIGINDPERRYNAYAHELSGGMAQRVLIAMALICEPEVFVADEPTSGLDVTIQAQVLDDLAAAVQQARVSVLIITQNAGVVANYCDRVQIMADGRTDRASSVEEFFAMHGSSMHGSASTVVEDEGRREIHGMDEDERAIAGP